ncbi:MAG: peroxiredoxin [Candidatus Thermoplasmatota archaeon]|jgi:peroxiredoxin (alkyl hydroperoxide reductase subunit C)|nr:peroxiredoxin [Candidatus Thermoplasmatota archaeon]MCL5984519.1 peroxiredoxin [Candidatus Thermoplasmatota archaeon]
MLSQKLPEYTLEAYDPKTEASKKINLPKDIAGHFTLIFFYPADFTFVCPTELADLQNRKAEFEKLGLEVIVASTDTVFTHKAWVESEELLHGFGYLMAADHNGSFSRALGIYNEASGLAQRASFLVDPDGIVRAEYRVESNIGRSAGEILRLAKSLKFVRENPGAACPASWDEGAATLTPGLKIVGHVGEALKKAQHAKA